MFVQISIKSYFHKFHPYLLGDKTLSLMRPRTENSGLIVFKFFATPQSRTISLPVRMKRVTILSGISKVSGVFFSCGAYILSLLNMLYFKCASGPVFIVMTKSSSTIPSVLS